MSKQFDITFKELLDRFSDDWIQWLAPEFGLPKNTRATAIDADLSTIQLSVDKAFQLEPPGSGILHIETQSTWENDFEDRLAMYNTQLNYRYGGPVYTVVLLLRPEANMKQLNGEYTRRFANGEIYWHFRYRVVRLWEYSVDQIQHLGYGALPLVFLSNEAKGRLPDLVQTVTRELSQSNYDEEVQKVLLFASFLLCGLRYNENEIEQAFQGVRLMKESVTYQAILKEGIEKGRVEGMEKGRVEGMEKGIETGKAAGLREALLLVLRQQHQQLPELLLQKIADCTQPEQLQQALLFAMQGNHLDNLGL